ncbi:PAS domain-containing protein, partial [Acinetobacter baumannii]
IDTAPDAVLMVDDQGCVRAANGAAEAIFKRSTEDLIDLSVEQLVPLFAAATGGDPTRPFGGASLECMLGQTLSATGRRADGG